MSRVRLSLQVDLTHALEMIILQARAYNSPVVTMLIRYKWMLWKCQVIVSYIYIFFCLPRDLVITVRDIIQSVGHVRGALRTLSHWMNLCRSLVILVRKWDGKSHQFIWRTSFSFWLALAAEVEDPTALSLPDSLPATSNLESKAKFWVHFYQAIFLIYTCCVKLSRDY